MKAKTVKWLAVTGTLSLVVPHAVLVTCHHPCTQSPSSTAAYQMDTIKKKYKKAKGQVKDLLRPPSRQSALTTPARSPRSSQEPTAPPGHRISNTPSVIVQASQTAIAPTAIATMSTDIPALEASAPEPSPQSEHTPDSAATYAQPPSVTSKLATMASVCNDLFTVVHGASDAFPPLKSALGGILEIWKQCEVRYRFPKAFDHVLTAASEDRRGRRRVRKAQEQARGSDEYRRYIRQRTTGNAHYRPLQASCAHCKVHSLMSHRIMGQQLL